MPPSSAAAEPPTNGRVRLLIASEAETACCEFDFGTLTFDAGYRLSPKAAQVFFCLLQQAGQTLSKDQLLNQAWPGQARVPDVLVQAIADIRRGLGEPLRQSLRTLPKRGYRLDLQVVWLAPDCSAAMLASAPTSGPTSAAAGQPAPVRRFPWRWLAVVGALALSLYFLNQQRVKAKNMKPEIRKLDLAGERIKQKYEHIRF